MTLKFAKHFVLRKFVSGIYPPPLFCVANHPEKVVGDSMRSYNLCRALHSVSCELINYEKTNEDRKRRFYY